MWKVGRSFSKFLLLTYITKTTRSKIKFNNIEISKQNHINSGFFVQSWITLGIQNLFRGNHRKQTKLAQFNWNLSSGFTYVSMFDGCVVIFEDTFLTGSSSFWPAMLQRCTVNWGFTATPTLFSVCEYLRDFDEKMEGTVDGMKLALPAPTCNQDGSFSPQQCAMGRCWCVDSFGTEIPETSTKNASSVDCDK